MNKAKQEKMIKDTLDLIDGLVSGEIKIPNNSLVMDREVMGKILTKKRIELLDAINKIKPKSVQDLASAVNRKKQAVDRDLKMLELHEIIGLKRKGRCAIPFIKRKVVVLPLVSNFKLNEEDIVCASAKS